MFCGSSFGTKGVYREAAKKLGVHIADKKMTLVYGGATSGLMGVLAESVVDKGGEVVGVMPKVLNAIEIPYAKLTKLMEVGTLAERKMEMYKLADMFVALPGGIGTMDELCEIVTLSIIGEFDKPIYLLNVDGYYEHYIKHLQKMSEDGFFKTKYLDLVTVINEENFYEYIKI